MIRLLSSKPIELYPFQRVPTISRYVTVPATSTSRAKEGAPLRDWHKGRE
ncbi:unnamed protein product [Meloidogyne enterolobii]|uniref:Uncharacterized protein n=1 Tax=Meloidogyne enterolobii TaxID=390850 RepID=A0ACB0YI36_MELEN